MHALGLNVSWLSVLDYFSNHFLSFAAWRFLSVKFGATNSEVAPNRIYCHECFFNTMGAEDDWEKFVPKDMVFAIFLESCETEQKTEPHSRIL